MYLYGIKNYDDLPMNQHNYDKQHTLNGLVSEYESMSQKGTVVFYEEAVFFQLIDYYESEQSLEQAIAVADLALSQYNFSSGLYCKKAYLLASKKHNAAAIEAIEKAEILSPGDSEIRLAKSNLLGLLEEYDTAFAIIEELKASNAFLDNTKLAEISYVEGALYERMHEYDLAFHAWKQALMLNPNHTEVLSRIWICIEMTRNFEESIELCNKILDNNPYYSMAWYNLGHAHTYFGNYSEAIHSYEYAFITNEKFEWAYRHCAELCMEIQDFKKALDCYEEVLSHIQPDVEILFKIGQCYYFLNKTKIAQVFFERSIKLDEINDEVYFYLGKCATLQKNWKDAIYYYKRAIEIEGKQEEYYAHLANAYAAHNNSEKAFHYFNRAIELAPEQAFYWVEFASFLMSVNAMDAAWDILIDAEEYAVGPELTYCKAACLFKMGKRKEGMLFLEEAITDDFEMHPILFKYIPELKTDKKIKAMLKFFEHEN